MSSFSEASRYVSLSLARRVLPDFSWTDVMHGIYTGEPRTIWGRLALIFRRDEGVRAGFEQSVQWIENNGGPRPAPYLVELGTGSGYPVVEMLKKGVIDKAICVDYDQDVIIFAKAYAKKEGVADKIHFIGANVTDPGLGSKIQKLLEEEVEIQDDMEGVNGVPIVRCVGVLEYMKEDERIKTLKNAYNILGEGGQIIIGSTSLPENWEKGPAWKNKLQDNFFSILGEANGFLVYRGTLEETRELARKAGFLIQDSRNSGPYNMVNATKLNGLGYSPLEIEVVRESTLSEHA